MCCWESSPCPCQMIHGVTLEHVAEIAAARREHPKLWPTKQTLQRESRGSDFLPLLPAAKLLKTLLKIWLLLNITLIRSLSATESCKLYGEILPLMWQNYLITLQHLNFPGEASIFPIFKHILPKLIEWMWLLDCQRSEKKAPKVVLPDLRGESWSSEGARGHGAWLLASIPPGAGKTHGDGCFYFLSGLLLMAITWNENINFHSYYPWSLEHRNILNYRRNK